MCEHVIHFFVTFTFIFPFPFPFACFPFTVYSHSPIFKTMLFCLIFFIHSFIHYMSSSRWAFTECRPSVVRRRWTARTKQVLFVRQSWWWAWAAASASALTLFFWQRPLLLGFHHRRRRVYESSGLQTQPQPQCFVNTTTGHFLLCRKSLWSSGARQLVKSVSRGDVTSGASHPRSDPLCDE